MTSADQRAGMEDQPIVLRRASVTGSHDSVARIPGIGLMHADTIFGVPPVFTHLLTNLPAIYKIVVFVTVRHVALCRSSIPCIIYSKECVFQRLRASVGMLQRKDELQPLFDRGLHRSQSSLCVYRVPALTC